MFLYSLLNTYGSSIAVAMGTLSRSLSARLIALDPALGLLKAGAQ